MELEQQGTGARERELMQEGSEGVEGVLRGTVGMVKARRAQRGGCEGIEGATKGVWIHLEEHEVHTVCSLMVHGRGTWSSSGELQGVRSHEEHPSRQPFRHRTNVLSGCVR